MSGSCIHIFLLLIPGLDHRPDCFVFPCGRQVKVWRNAWPLHPGYRQTKPHIGWMLFENDVQTILLSWRLEFCWRERPAWKHGHWEHLDVTHETADCARGETLKFSTSGITKVGY